jgi:hypothetical protein
MVSVLGPAPKPKVVWEEQFDYHDDELVRLATLDWDRVAGQDLWYYFHDLAYQELQPDLFRHLFPACLNHWYVSLMRNAAAASGDSDFHYGLAQGQIIEKMLTERERELLFDFFRDGFLDRIESERGFVMDVDRDPLESMGSEHAWIFRFNSLGIVAPATQRIWEDWWSLDHPGKAVCAVMYASGLIYWEGENPIYRTTERGGGGPYLTEIDCPIYEMAWRSDNLAFLTRTLTTDYVQRKLDQAAAILSDCPEAAMARWVADEAKARADVISMRIDLVLENLSRQQQAKDPWT